MAKISIPEQHVSGFLEISKLTKVQAHEFAEYLNTIQISINVNKVLDDINDFLSLKLKINKSESIVQTIVSFVELIKPSEEEQLADDLTEAYTNLNHNTVHGLGKNKTEQLRDNLKAIVKNCSRLTLVFKAVDLAFGNDMVLSEAKIISDLRIIFEDTPVDSLRNAIVLHKLNIRYSKAGKREDAFFTMDLEDLQKLKSAVELAIQNDTLIKEDFKNNLTFI